MARGLDAASIDDLIHKEISKRSFPGAAYAIGNATHVHVGCLGTYTYDKSSVHVDDRSLYDLASLTKVVATTPAAMLLHDDGVLDLDKPVVEYLPNFKGKDKERVVVRNLLLHDSGLPAYATLTKYATREEARRAVLELPLKAKPGQQTEYS